jgi:hypothetical protein
MCYISMRCLFPVSTGFFATLSEFGIMKSCFQGNPRRPVALVGLTIKPAKSAAYSALSTRLRPVLGPFKSAFPAASQSC